MMTLEETLLAAAFADNYFTFRLGERIYGFEARGLWEIAASVTLSSLPRSSAQLVGITQLHGKIIPVVDLDALLRPFSPGSGPSSVFIAVKPPGFDSPTGFFATQALGFEKFQETGLLPPQNGKEFRKGLAGTPERPVELLEMGRILGEVRKSLAAGAEGGWVGPGRENEKTHEGVR